MLRHVHLMPACITGPSELAQASHEAVPSHLLLGDLIRSIQRFRGATTVRQSTGQGHCLLLGEASLRLLHRLLQRLLGTCKRK